MTPKISPGKVLLAEPFMIDTNFKRAVVLLCDHNIDGTVGFILNREYNAQIGEVVPELEGFDAPIYCGGPVQKDTLHYIHNVGNLLDNSQEVCNGVYWGGDFEILIFLIQNKMIKPENIMFFVGYSGWTADQLGDEFKYGSWLLAEMDTNYLFKKKKQKALWNKIMSNKGDSYSIIAQMPDYFSWN